MAHEMSWQVEYFREKKTQINPSQTFYLKIDDVYVCASLKKRTINASTKSLYRWSVYAIFLEVLYTKEK